MVGLLIMAAVVIATVYGFLGLFILGAGTTLVCVLAELNQDVAGCGSRGVSGADAAGRVAGAAGGDAGGAAAIRLAAALLSTLRSGLLAAIGGAAGSAWQIWG